MIYTKETVYKKALKEVHELINVLSDDERNKIPNSYISTVEKEMDNSHNFKYDTKKRLSEQNFMNESKAMIVDIYIKYFSTKEESEKWARYYKISNKLIEEEKINKFNPNNIFTTCNEKNEETVEEKSLIEIKESFFKNIINKIKNLINQFFQ